MALAVGLFLVPQHLAVQLVGERVDRRVHVGIDALGVDVLAAYMQVGRDLLPELVDGQNDVHVDDMVEMPGHAVELRSHVTANGRRDDEMMTAQVQVHQVLLQGAVRWPCAN